MKTESWVVMHPEVSDHPQKTEKTSQNRSTEHRIWSPLLFTSTSQASNPAVSWVGNPFSSRSTSPRPSPACLATIRRGALSHKSQQQHLPFLDGVLPVMSPKDISPIHTTIPRHCEFGYTVNRKTSGICLMEEFIVTRGREETQLYNGPALFCMVAI